MPDTQWIEPLLQSDREYFEAGAERIEFDGGELLWTLGLQEVPAGCVAIPDLPIASPESFAAEAARLASSVGAPLVRFYTPSGGADESAALARAGLGPAVELLVVRDIDLGFERHCTPPPAQVRAVETDSAWIEKLELALALDHLPDGKEAAAAQWTELERRKCEAGYMDMWLIEAGARVLGSFGLARIGSLLRLKNLVIHPDARRMGLGRTAIDFALERAREEGLSALGAYALTGSAGSALYESCGFEVIGEQVEWSGASGACIATPAVASEVQCR